MEIAGRELYDEIDALGQKKPRETIPPAQAKSIMLQVASGIRYLHEVKHIAHRDLKPENILVQTDQDGNYVAKIIDFGLAIKNVETWDILVGSPSYLAPEASDYRKKDNKVDIWTFG